MRKYLNYYLFDFMINQGNSQCLNYDSFDFDDSCDFQKYQGNPLIIKSTVQTTISENFKTVLI
jgi:hypothetical protein